MFDLTFYLKKIKFLRKIPLIRRLAFKYLIYRNPLKIIDISFQAKYQNSYSLISEKKSLRFRKIVRRLECYIGSSPIGPNKYWEYLWVIANLNLKKGLSVLDVGCGKSPLQFLLADLGCEVFAIDPYENVKWHGINRKLAKLFNCKITYRKEGGEAISYNDNSFDGVYCVSVIEHCTRDVQLKIMKEMIRVLKSGGLCVITVDYNIPRTKEDPISNVNVANLINMVGIESVGIRTEEKFPGEPDFNYINLIENPDINISSYFNQLGTSIGLTLRKKSGNYN